MCKTGWIDRSKCTLVASIQDTMGGAPVLKGTEITVQSLVDDIGDGRAVEAVADEYGLNPADVKAVYEYCERRGPWVKSCPAFTANHGW